MSFFTHDAGSPPCRPQSAQWEWPRLPRSCSSGVDTGPPGHPLNETMGFLSGISTFHWDHAIFRCLILGSWDYLLDGSSTAEMAVMYVFFLDGLIGIRMGDIP